MTLNFKLVTSKSNQFIFVRDSNSVTVNLVKFQQAVCEILCLHTFSI